jgi:hypothetical protein
MKHAPLMGIAGTVIRSAPVLVFGAFAAASLAYTVRWHQTNVRSRGRAPFSLVATPASRNVTAGGKVQYRIAIHRGRYRGRLRLTVASLGLLSRHGVRMGNRASLKVTGRRALLTVQTTSVDPPRRYPVKLKAVGGRYRGYLTVGLTIMAPEPASFRVTGNSGPLWPGTAQAVDLALTNPNPQAIAIRSLTVSIEKVTAPRSTGSLPCSTADFAVSQFRGSYPLNVPADATVHLSDLGVPSTMGPQLQMLDRPVNQNGCQGATLTLSYRGTATSP